MRVALFQIQSTRQSMNTRYLLYVIKLLAVNHSYTIATNKRIHTRKWHTPSPPTPSPCPNHSLICILCYWCFFFLSITIVSSHRTGLCFIFSQSKYDSSRYIIRVCCCDFRYNIIVFTCILKYYFLYACVHIVVSFTTPVLYLHFLIVAALTVHLFTHTCRLPALILSLLDYSTWNSL